MGFFGGRGGTYTSGKSKLQVVGAEGVVFDGGIDDFREEVGFAEEVFGDAEPEAEELD